MEHGTLNPVGSDALALANVIAPQMTGTLTTIAEFVGILTALLAVSALVAVIWAVQIDYDVVAVTPGGALVPLNQLDKSNEQALRARLAANAPAPQARRETPAPHGAQSNVSPGKRATNQ